MSAIDDFDPTGAGGAGGMDPQMRQKLAMMLMGQMGQPPTVPAGAGPMARQVPNVAGAMTPLMKMLMMKYGIGANAGNPMQGAMQSGPADTAGMPGMGGFGP